MDLKPALYRHNPISRDLNVLEYNEAIHQKETQHLPASSLIKLLNTPYLMGEEIGSGSFAKVFEGVHRQNGERVAIKQVNKKKFGEHISYIDSEIAVLSQLTNEHIIRFHDFFNEDDNYIYIVTELCELGDLEQFIATNFDSTCKQLPESLVKVFAYQILLAFLGIADRNIIHRDMKLSNLLITQQLKLKIADFGLAKSSIGRESDSVGSPITMAPEVLNNEAYSSPCDVWSVGCIIYEMFEGKSPFAPQKGGGIKELKSLIKHHNITYTNPKVSATAKDLIQKMLTIDPTKRITWHKMFSHEWFAECLSKGDSLIQEVSQEFINYIVYEEKHLDPAYASYFGQILREFVNRSVGNFVSTVECCWKQLDKMRTLLPIVKGQINSCYVMILELMMCLFKSEFQIKQGSKVIRLSLTSLSKDGIIFAFPEINQMRGELESAAAIQEKLAKALVELSVEVMQANFEIFSKQFQPVIKLLSMMQDRREGVISEVKINKVKEQDAERIMFINIPRAYADESNSQSSCQNEVQREIGLIKVVHTHKLHEKFSQFEEKIQLLRDVVKQFQVEEKQRKTQINTNHHNDQNLFF